MVRRSMGYVFRPSTVEGIQRVLAEAERAGKPVVPRGSGYSYGDASILNEGIVLDLTRMRRVLEWDPSGGRIRLEPGVTVRQLWQTVLEDGWWPPVVPGAMYPTLGGCVSTNVHGKNNWRLGTIGDHIEALELMLPSGEISFIDRESGPDLLRAVIGGAGMLGVVTSLTLQLQPVPSGLLEIEQSAAPNLDAMFDAFEQRLDRADYLVGWIDAFARGSSLGRGLVQSAAYVQDDIHPLQKLRASYQDLPDTILGMVPRSQLWRGMRPLVNDTGMSAINRARYGMGSLRSGRTLRQPHAQFHFFHDFVPNWKRSFWPGGIVEYQIFLPADTARSAFGDMLERSQAAGLYPYLAVFKRHRSDSFLLSYGVDGYSLSLDYHLTDANEQRLRSFLERSTRDVV
ncbi:MAG: FAD-binding oxidoreductase, partial [Chloroflexota bacterium]